MGSWVQILPGAPILKGQQSLALFLSRRRCMSAIDPLWPFGVSFARKLFVDLNTRRIQ